MKCARQGSVLPFLLIASCAPALAGGQFGQPTESGFAVLGAGLTLAAMQGRKLSKWAPPPVPAQVLEYTS